MITRILLFLLFSTCSALAQNKGIFLVTRHTLTPKATIVVNYKDLLSHKSVRENEDFDIIDGNFGKTLTKKIVDDHVVINYVFESDEPVYSFLLKPNGKQLTRSSSNVSIDKGLTITYLSNRTGITNWPDKIIGSFMSFSPELAKFDDQTAFFLTAMFARWKETKNPAYLNYIKKWADRFIDSHGYIDPKYYKVQDYGLDNLLPGRIFISLYEATKDPRYKGAAQQLRQQLQYQPRTSDGGYWQRQSYKYQMWLDGTYMSDVFMMQYAKAFDEPALFKEAMQQINLVHEHNGDPETGLLYHGWDESGNPAWANEETGTSPEFWSRGIGWYYLALLECIDYIPLESPDRKELGTLFREVTKPVLKFQDQKTGLWYQLINKGYEPRNWFETSASAMFAYGFAKGYNRGIFDKSYLALAQKTFETLQRDHIFFDEQDRLYFDGAVVGASLDPKISKGDLDYYVSKERRVNDYKALGALLYLTMELD